MNVNIKRIAAALGISAIALVGTTASASAYEPNITPSATAVPTNIKGWQVADGTLFAADMNPDLVKWFIAGPYNNTVDTNTVKDGALAEKDLNATVRAKLTIGEGSVTSTFDAKDITNIGGSFATRATLLGKFDLQPGTWLVTTNATFNRTVSAAAGDPVTRPQLALRYGDDYTTTPVTWGTDAGTIMGVALSPTKDRELVGSSFQTVTVTEKTEVHIYGFGYNDDTSQTFTGNLNVASSTTATRIN